MILPNKKTFLSIIRILVWGIVYYFINWFSLTYFLNSDGYALAWPPVGIYISAILLTPSKKRPLLIGVMLIADIAAEMQTGVSLMIQISYALLSTGDALISAWVVLRFVANPFVFTKVKNFLLYLLFSVILCHGIFSILVSAVTHYTLGSMFWPGVLISWVAVAVGNIMIVPFIISWSSLSWHDIKKLNPNRVSEIIILVIALYVSNIVLFPYFKNGILFSFIINYLSFPFIIWAILRFDMRIVTLVLLLLTVAMLVSLMKDMDIFQRGIKSTQFLFFQLYIASISIISIVITSTTAERNQARSELMESIKLLVEAERKLVFNSIEIEERERNRYSRELHDGLGPLLSTIKMYMQGLSKTSDDKVKFIAAESERNIKIAIQTMREVAHGLSPFNLSTFGYVNAVLEFIQGINKIQQMKIDFTYNSHDRFSDFYELILYRITTELINNTLKHSQATHAEIAFNYSLENNHISLVYHDNGRGFDASANEVKKGMGLINIQQRTRILDGNFSIESANGKGCTISVDFPLIEVNNHIKSSL